MRGIGHTLVRLPAATAFLAGAALLAGANPIEAVAQVGGPGTQPVGDDTALAIPRLSAPSGAEVALPQPLAPSEAAKLRRIFALQARGDIPAALRETAWLDTASPLSEAMLGHILAQRYLGPYTRPSADQLRDWLDRFADLPDARAIHGLLVLRMPRGDKAPPLPKPPLPPWSRPCRCPRRPSRTRRRWRATRRSTARCRRRRRGRAAPPAWCACSPIPADLTPGYAAQLRGEAAQILFAQNRDDEAFGLAAGGVHRAAPARRGVASMPPSPATGRARRVAARPRPRGGGDVCGGLAGPRRDARAQGRGRVLGGPRPSARRRRRRRTGLAARAAAQPRTFYGLIARRTLGLPIGVGRVRPGERETLGEADIDAVAATRQACAPSPCCRWASRSAPPPSCAALWPEARQIRPLARALMLVRRARRPARPRHAIADLLAAADGRPRAATCASRCRGCAPRAGFTSTRRWSTRLARTESNFDADLRLAGRRARADADHAGDRAASSSAARASRRFRSQLRDPAVNLDLGQRYLAYLAGARRRGRQPDPAAGRYNAGPANFAHWAAQIRDEGDPLLFIEAIPVDETRGFVPRVLTYTWIYASPACICRRTSLDELAARRIAAALPCLRAAAGAYRVQLH